MNCNQFDRSLAEWVKGRLLSREAEQMTDHASRCAVCARAEVVERELQDSWTVLSATPRTPDLRVAFAARLSKADAKPRRSASWPRRLAFGGSLSACAAVAITWLVLLRNPGPLTPGPSADLAVDEAHVVRLVSDMQRLPDTTSEFAFDDRYGSAEADSDGPGADRPEIR